MKLNCQRDDSLVPVLSLLFFRNSACDQVLLGVRSPSATSPRHPDVLSTPTMRLPVSTMAQLLAGTGVQMPLAAPSFVRLGSGPAWPLGGPMSLSSPQAFVAEALLSRKLGLADALVDGTVRASLSQVAVAYDVVHDDEGGYENTLMLTMKCVLAESLTMPVKTASYSRLEWVASDAVGPAVAARDATVLLPDVPVWQICIHGLCVRSAAFALD